MEPNFLLTRIISFIMIFEVLKNNVFGGKRISNEATPGWEVHRSYLRLRHVATLKMPLQHRTSSFSEKPTITTTELENILGGHLQCHVLQNIAQNAFIALEETPRSTFKVDSEVLDCCVSIWITPKYLLYPVYPAVYRSRKNCDSLTRQIFFWPRHQNQCFP